MNGILIELTFLAFQINTLQAKPVVHLRPHHSVVDAEDGGKLLELINAPAIVYLPVKPPATDSNGNPWAVDVKNLGPSAVRLSDSKMLTVKLSLNQTVHISAHGMAYSVK